MCLLCKDKGLEVKYIGESARTCYERGLEHQEDAVNPSKKSHMRQHMVESHPDEVSRVLDVFEMRVIKTARSALARQLREVVQINRGGAPVELQR